jgi:hypothetical protein
VPGLARDNDKVDRFGYKEKTIITRKGRIKRIIIKQTISRKMSEGEEQKRK